MDINKAIKLALDGNAVLFLGSGFSTGGINIAGEYMKIGAGLSHVICDDLGIERSDNLTISSDRYLNDETCKKSLEDLIELLKKECTCSKPSEPQEIIVRLPWYRIYTTNYDNIIEMCSKKNHCDRASITITNKRYKASRILEQAIIHINGFIETINPSTFYDEFKITDESYTRDGLLESSWRDLFENDLRMSKAIVFIGYSLQYDQDIVRCIAQMAIRDKCIFIDVNSISSDSAYKISRYGSLERIGVEGFANHILSISNVYTPKTRIIELKGFDERTDLDYQCEEHYSSKDVYQLIGKGYMQTKFITQKYYCVHREKSIQIIKDNIASKKIIIIQSYLGNGKTVFLDCLASSLVEEYSVYYLNDTETFDDDINLVQSTCVGRSVLLIDDGDKYRNILYRLKKSFPEKFTIITTCRSTTNAHLYYNLIENHGFLPEDIYIHDLDYMDDSEVNELCNVLNHSRLWGSFDTLSNTAKKDRIKKDYERQLSRVFYLLLDSKHIENEIAKVMHVLDKNIRMRDFVLAQIINSLCQLKFSYADICKFTNISYDDLVNFTRDDIIKELIDVGKSQFLIRSPIFLQYVIRKTDYIDDIIKIMSDLFRSCSRNDEQNKRYEGQRRNMVSRSDILLVISRGQTPTQEDEKKIFNYYDGIKNLPTAKYNPFFWLQFAITTLNLNDFNLADIYFSNAYANAKQIIDFNTYQIDTHYARLLLLREIKTNNTNKDEALDIFYQAHDLLYENSHIGKLDYSLRQTGVYEDYYKRYSVLMSDDEKESFLCVAAQFIDRYYEYFTENKLVAYSVRASYKKYRKLFDNTRFVIKINQCDSVIKEKSQYYKSVGKVVKPRRDAWLK